MRTIVRPLAWRGWCLQDWRQTTRAAYSESSIQTRAKISEKQPLCLFKIYRRRQQYILLLLLLAVMLSRHAVGLYSWSQASTHTRMVTAAAATYGPAILQVVVKATLLIIIITTRLHLGLVWHCSHTADWRDVAVALVASTKWYGSVSGPLKRLSNANKWLHAFSQSPKC